MPHQKSFGLHSNAMPPQNYFACKLVVLFTSALYHKLLLSIFIWTKNTTPVATPLRNDVHRLSQRMFFLIPATIDGWISVQCFNNCFTNFRPLSVFRGNAADIVCGVLVAQWDVPSKILTRLAEFCGNKFRSWKKPLFGLLSAHSHLLLNLSFLSPRRLRGVQPVGSPELADFSSRKWTSRLFVCDAWKTYTLQETTCTFSEPVEIFRTGMARKELQVLTWRWRGEVSKRMTLVSALHCSFSCTCPGALGA